MTLPIQSTPKTRKRRDHTGERYGRWLVTGFDRRDRKFFFWMRVCDCGTVRSVSIASLRCGKSKSCGCYHREQVKLSRSSAESLGNKAAIRSYKMTAQKRDLPWELTDEFFFALIQNECFYCGAPPSNSFEIYRTERQKFFYSGVDRKNNEEGYTPSNVVPCCKRCNIAKNDRDFDEFLSWAKRVAARAP